MEKLSLSPIFTTGDGAFPSVEGRKVPLPAGSGPRTACPPSQSSLAQAQKNWDGTGHPAWGWRLARWDPTGTAATPNPQYSTTTTQAGVATRQIGQTLVPEFLPKYPVLILWLAIPSTGRPPGTGLWSVHLLCRSGSGEGTLPLPRHQLTPPGCLLWMPPSPTTIPLPGQSLLSASPSSQPFSSTLFRDRSSCLAMPRPLASCSIASRADSHKSPSSLWWMCTFSLQFQTKCPVSGRPPSPRTPRRLRASDPAPLPPPSLPPPPQRPHELGVQEPCHLQAGGHQTVVAGCPLASVCLPIHDARIGEGLDGRTLVHKRGVGGRIANSELGLNSNPSTTVSIHLFLLPSLLV